MSQCNVKTIKNKPLTGLDTRIVMEVVCSPKDPQEREKNIVKLILVSLAIVLFVGIGFRFSKFSIFTQSICKNLEVEKENLLLPLDPDDEICYVSLLKDHTGDTPIQLWRDYYNVTVLVPDGAVLLQLSTIHPSKTEPPTEGGWHVAIPNVKRINCSLIEVSIIWWSTPTRVYFGWKLDKSSVIKNKTVLPCKN